MNLSYRNLALASLLFAAAAAVIVLAVHFALTGLAGPGTLLLGGGGMCVAAGVSLLRTR